MPLERSRERSWERHKEVKHTHHLPSIHSTFLASLLHPPLSLLRLLGFFHPTTTRSPTTFSSSSSSSSIQLHHQLLYFGVQGEEGVLPGGFSCRELVFCFSYLGGERPGVGG